MATERHPVAFLVGAAIGGLFGGYYGLRHARRPGAETWARLTERWHDVGEQAGQTIAQFDNTVRGRVSANDPPAETIRVSLTIEEPGKP